MNKKVLSFLILLAFVVAPFVIKANIDDPLGGASFQSIASGIATYVAGLAGAAATAMFSLAGIFYLTSAGSPQRMNAAKTTLMYAIIGLAIALSAAGIVSQLGGLMGG